jgi:hypothetical protein
VFVAKLDVGDDHGQELELGDDLMVPVEPGVELAAVDDEAGVEPLNSLEGDRGSFHVLESRLELGLVPRCNEPLGVDRESGVIPASKEVDSLVVDLVLLSKEDEERFAKEELGLCEVHLGILVEVSLGIKDSKRREPVTVRVEIEERPKGLRRRDEGGTRFVEVGEARFEELANRSEGGAAEIAVEGVIELEEGAKDLGDREGERGIRYLGQNVFDHVFGPGKSALLATAGAEASSFTREGQQSFGLTAWTLKFQKTKVRITTRQKPPEEIDDPRCERTVGRPETLLPMSFELIEVAFDDGFENVVGRSRPVGDLAEGEGHGASGGGKRSRGRGSIVSPSARRAKSSEASRNGRSGDRHGSTPRLA